VLILLAGCSIAVKAPGPGWSHRYQEAGNPRHPENVFACIRRVGFTNEAYRVTPLHRGAIRAPRGSEKATC